MSAEVPLAESLHEHVKHCPPSFMYLKGERLQILALPITGDEKDAPNASGRSSGWQNAEVQSDPCFEVSRNVWS